MFDHLKNRKLYRLPNDAILFGIAAGLGRYLQVDAVFLRLLFIIAAVASGIWPIVVLYMAALFVIPIDPTQDTVARTQQPKDVTGSAPPESAPAQPVERMDRDQNM